jgi:Helix-turn-helix domain
MKQKVTKNLIDFFDLRYVEEHYPISRRKAQQLIHAERLRAYRIDRKIFVRRADLERLLTANPVGEEIDRLVGEVASEILGK